jgi:hypothetical protein
MVQLTRLGIAWAFVILGFTPVYALPTFVHQIAQKGVVIEIDYNATPLLVIPPALLKLLYLKGPRSGALLPYAPVSKEYTRINSVSILPSGRVVVKGQLIDSTTITKQWAFDRLYI